MSSSPDPPRGSPLYRESKPPGIPVPVAVLVPELHVVLVEPPGEGEIAVDVVRVVELALEGPEHGAVVRCCGVPQLPLDASSVSPCISTCGFHSVRLLIRNGGLGLTTSVGAPFIPRRSPTSREKRDLDVVMGCSGLNSNCALTASPNDSGVAISTLALWMSGKDPRNRPGAPKNLYLTSVWLLYEVAVHLLLHALQPQRLGAGEGAEDGVDDLVGGRRVELLLQLGLLRDEGVDGALQPAYLLSLRPELVLFGGGVEGGR